MQTLTCPKCQSAMRTYERSGITVDQCTECRGIFLDRGELERLVDAEAAFDGPAVSPQAPRREPEYDRPRYEEKRYEDKRYEDKRFEDKRFEDKPRYDDRHGNQQYPHRKKKKSFFEELFD